ncbi:MAG: hypothetical protein HRU07_00095 [Nitrosopumilus sp.]|nr:hypothetical protein [Nitrosopumilus sp.]NRA04581.1 hypothetical protein [Nitrosopumilus sp.]
MNKSLELSKTDDTTQRQNQVYRLHFDYGYNSEKLASLLDVELQIIENNLEYCYGIRRKETNEIQINEKLIRHIVLFLTLKYAKNPRLTEKSIKSEIINLENCTTQQADSIYHHMYELGLNQCSIMVSGFEYDLFQFALLRRYVHQGDTFAKCLLSLCMLYNTQPFEKSDLSKQFVQQHGKKEDWNDVTHEKYSKELEELHTKHTKVSNEIFVEAFEELNYDEEKFVQYTKYIAVKFGCNDNEKQLFERMFDD